MALLKLQSGQEINQLPLIKEHLSSIGVELSHWPIEKDKKISSLLEQDTLTHNEKNELLEALDFRFEEQKKIYGYKSRDLVVLHKDVPGLDDMLQVFDKTHTHSDDEVRYIIDGSGYFGFSLPDKTQCLLKVEAEEYIRVPAMTEHWFLLDTNRKIKAVRYFVSPDGWAANYTGTEIKIG